MAAVSQPFARRWHRHDLYEASVQAADLTIDAAEAMFGEVRGHAPRILGEDFCGTGLIAAEWVRRNPDHEAWAVDVDGPTLAWGQRARKRQFGDAVERLHWMHEDVLTVQTPPLDLLLASNFSYFVFQERVTLGRYFRQVWNRLAPGGVFLLDHFAGTGAMTLCRETRPVRGARTWRGEKIPPFTFVWEHQRFNVINHHLQAAIHFEFRDGSRLTNAFRYRWRYWTLPEIVELLEYAGFSTPTFYTHGWDGEGDADDAYQPETSVDNDYSFLGYFCATKD